MKTLLALLCGLFFGALGYNAWQEEKDRRDRDVMKSAIDRWLVTGDYLNCIGEPPTCDDGCLCRTSYVDADGNVHHYRTSYT